MKKDITKEEFDYLLAKGFSCPCCFSPLYHEREEALAEDYPFVCLKCDENYYESEAIKKRYN